MSRRFFYNSHTLTPLSQYRIGDNLSLTADIHHHWCRVLRANIGDTASLFDGLGGEYAVELIEISKKTSVVKLLAFHNIDNTPMMATQVGLVMSRGERMDYAIQKATEMGVTCIQLLNSHHGEVRLKPAQVSKKLNHWQQVAISACEQCGMNRIPLIIAPLSITDWFDHIADDIDEISAINKSLVDISSNICDYMQPITNDNFYQNVTSYDNLPDLSLVLTVPKQDESPIPLALPKLINNLTEELTEKLKINKCSEKNNKYATPFFRLLIGAEGGLSVEEITKSRQIGFQPWQIGNRVLRTETAPVVALATLQAFFTAKSIF